jgi:hypothetical protein
LTAPAGDGLGAPAIGVVLGGGAAGLLGGGAAETKQKRTVAPAALTSDSTFTSPASPARILSRTSRCNYNTEIKARGKMRERCGIHRCAGAHACRPARTALSSFCPRLW